jgi:hypothetical protein
MALVARDRPWAARLATNAGSFAEQGNITLKANQGGHAALV